MFGFLRKAPPAIGSLEVLGVDMHAHWLPALDDGAKDMSESLHIISRLVEMGYHKLIASPHIMADVHPNTSQDILEKLRLVREAVAAEDIPVELDAAAEYLLDDQFMRLLETGDLLTLPGNHLLVEFSFVAPPPTRDAIFFKILSKGYLPILAHPERYRFYHTKFEEYRNMVDRGVKLQVNLLSLTGYYGSSAKRVALRLIDQGLVSILGTDVHHDRHLQEMHKLIGKAELSQPISDRVWVNQSLFN